MDEAGKRTPIEPGLIQRLVGGARQYLSSTTAWFGPLTPMKPMAPDDQKGRAWNYPVGYNLVGQPRAETGGVSFADLRALARNSDIMRTVIETRKDQVAANSWTIQVKSPDGRNKIKAVQATPEQEERLLQVTEFLKMPDKIQTWDSWIRSVLEDLFVIDAPTIYIRRNRGGGVHALELIDGSTIKPLIDDTGRRPEAPSPAYQQWLHGVAAFDYTSDELIYWPRNRSTYSVYGYSPVEQVIYSVSTAIRRATFALNYYKEGNDPLALISVPETWGTDQVKSFQAYWDSQISGQHRHKIRFTPANMHYQELKEPPMKDQFDEWLARIICFAMSVDPQAFVKDINRATAETSRKRALQEGLVPVLLWIKGLINHIIAKVFGFLDIEFVWKDEQDIDPLIQAQTDAIYIDRGVLSQDEVRETLGREPIGGNFATPSRVQQGANPLQALLSGGSGARDPIEMLLAGGEKDPLKELLGGSEPPKKDPLDALLRLSVGALMKNSPTSASPKVKEWANQSIKDKLKAAFEVAAQEIAAQLRASKKMAKASSDYPPEWFDLDLDVVIGSTEEELQAVAESAGRSFLTTLGPSAPSGLVNQINTRGAAWAKINAARLVSDIDSTTRSMVSREIVSGLESGRSIDEIADNIAGMKSYAFSEERASLIARTEVGNASSGGTLEGFKAAEDLGLTILKEWQVDEDPCEVCLGNAADGPIPLDQNFSSGHQAPLAHPNCECVLLSRIEEGT